MAAPLRPPVCPVQEASPFFADLPGGNEFDQLMSVPRRSAEGDQLRVCVFQTQQHRAIAVSWELSQFDSPQAISNFFIFCVRLLEGQAELLESLGVRLNVWLRASVACV